MGRIADAAPITRAQAEECAELLARAVKARLAMDRITIVDGKDGSRRLLTCAFRGVEHDLPDDVLVMVIRYYEQENPFPSP